MTNNNIENIDEMIPLNAYLPMNLSPGKYKLHYMVNNSDGRPIDKSRKTLMTDWQNYKSEGKSRWGNSDYIFAMFEIPEEENIWLFMGIYMILSRDRKKYKTTVIDKYEDLIGRLKIYSEYKAEAGRKNYYPNLDQCRYNDLKLYEILSKKNALK